MIELLGRRSWLMGWASLTIMVATAAAEDPFAANVRPTEPRTPEEERRGFRLPPGFRIELFAAEPQIQKPLNLAFDARGRLWVSGSTEYPYAAPPSRKGRDSIRILEDVNGDGRADKVTVFADQLNIPIGLYPYKSGCIAYDVPDICKYEDTDGDGKADRRERLIGPFDYSRDTHGMNNSFRRGFDGWIYANHGWANQSSVQAKDGSQAVMHGGNAYRFDPDGRHIDHFTHGQVNPYGSSFDPLGDLFTADCHTKPVMLLLRNGYYDSFGKPHNGLGYVPTVMEHLHGSTAIAGTTIYTGSNFPPAFRGNAFGGNVMTSRVNRDSIRRMGGSVQAIEEPDFIVSDDPWFRPVDLQVGPDGALYVADFYNKIIGHVEVPLDHPGRDRVRGRIWRVTYVGTKDKPARLDPLPDLRAADLAGLIAAFEHPNLGVRMRAGDELVDRLGSAAIPALRKAIRSASPLVRAHAMWALFRLKALPINELTVLAADSDPLVRGHAMRVMAETGKGWNAELGGYLHAGLYDDDALVRRLAADAVGRHPDVAYLLPLLDVYDSTPTNDVHLRHGIKLALLEVLRKPGILARWNESETPEKQKHADVVAEVCLALPTEAAGAYLLDFLKRHRPPKEAMAKYLTHAAKHLPSTARVEELAAIAQRSVATDIDLQLELLLSIRGGLLQRGLAEPPGVRGWGAELAGRLLASLDADSLAWSSWTADGMPGKPWKLEQRKSQDGVSALFLSSLPLGERYKGSIKSRPFVVPAALRYFVCGQQGHPDQPAANKNLIRLRLVGTDEIAAESLAPRNDVAQLVAWKLDKHAGKRGYIEVVDGLNLDGWAWLGVARFEPAVVAVPKTNPDVAVRRLTSAATLAEALKLRELSGQLRRIVADEMVPPEARAAAARALLSFKPAPAGGALVEILADAAVPTGLRQEVAAALLDPDAQRHRATLEKAGRIAPYRLQQLVADRLAESRTGGETLLDLATSGAVSPRVLRNPSVLGKLAGAKVANLQARVDKLTAALTPVDAELQKLMRDRGRAFARGKSSPARGAEVFAKNCAPCHQVAGKGNTVGPQLDGIGTRGVERVIEDVLDPNRNVDPQFFATVFTLTDGRVLSGMLRRTEGKSVHFVEQSGKELVLAADQIESQTKSKYSPMAANWGTVLSERDCCDLLSFLMNQRQEAKPGPVGWRATPIDARFRSEGVAVADVNRDGKKDILLGEVWYEAPDWKMHEIATPKDYGDGAGSYSSSFLCFADDIDKDGWPDLIVVGFPGEPCHWLRNPRGASRHWEKRLIAQSACNETPLYVDLLGDGRRVLVMGWQPPGQSNRGQMAWFEPAADPTQPWRMHSVSGPSSATSEVAGTQRYSHGLGVGDLNGDGRLDILCTGGWWEQPAQRTAADATWKFHPANLGEACSNMHVLDLNGDGAPDVLSCSAHAYGIWAYDRRGGREPSVFVRRDLFPKLVSQTHASLLVDIDGDGLADLVTGKRWWAHGPKGDPGSDEPAMLYWFKASKAADRTVSFTPHAIHNQSGVGLQFIVEDMNGDGAPDIVTSNKKGTFLFEQIRPAKP